MKSTERLNRRYVFVNNNMNLLLKLDKHKNWNEFAKHKYIPVISEKARKYIGYSCKTNNVDICWTLYRLAKELHQENIKYQLYNI
jgi:hypothetical protein